MVWVKILLRISLSAFRDGTDRSMFSIDFDKQRTVHLILAAIIMVAAVLELAILVSYPIPPGSDPGLRIWSAWRLAVLGERREPYPAFDVTLAILWMVCSGDLGRISSLFAVFLSATTVLPIFVFVKATTRHDGVALVSAFLIAFAFSLFEALSWGGYTSILALWFISAIFASLSDRNYGSFREKMLIVTVLSSGLLMSHFWSFFVYLGMIAVAFLTETLLKTLAGKRRIGEAAKIGIGSAFLSVAVTSYWWAPISPFLKDMVSPSFRGVPSAMRLWDAGYLLYFLQPNEFYNLYAPIGAFALIVYVFRERGRGVGNVLVLASWILVPLALTQAYYLGISVDYARLCYFPITPIVILSSVGLLVSLIVPYRFLTAMSRTLKPRFREFPLVKVTKIASSLLLAYLLLQSILGVNSVATVHFFQAAVYYQTVRVPELEGISWLGFKTTPEANIAASSSLAWWINGLIGRNTIASMSLRFITAKWQIPATSAANIILGEISYQADNGLMWIEDSNPSGKGRTPVFSLDSAGEKETVAILRDDRTLVHWDGGEYLLSEFLVVKMGWLAESDGEVSLVTEYQLEDVGLEVVKSVRMRKKTPFVEVDYQVYAPHGDLTGVSIEMSYPEELNYGKILKGRIRDSDLKWAALIDEDEEIFLAIIAKKWMRVKEFQEERRITGLRTKFYSRGGVSMHAVAYIGAMKYINDNQTISQLTQYSKNPLSEKPDSEDRLVYTDYLSLIEQFQINYIATRPEAAHKFEVEARTNLVYSSSRICIFSLS
jgi:hypothetical protein